MQLEEDAGDDDWALAVALQRSEREEIELEEIERTRQESLQDTLQSGDMTRSETVNPQFPGGPIGAACCFGMTVSFVRSLLGQRAPPPSPANLVGPPCTAEGLEARSTEDMSDDVSRSRSTSTADEVARLDPCAICLEEEQGVRCDGIGAHIICRGCLPKLVESQLDLAEGSDHCMRERRMWSAVGQERCPCHLDGCSGALPHEQLLLHLPSETRRRLEVDSEAARSFLCTEEPQDESEDLERVRLSFLMDMPNAKMCGSCQHGPIDHTHCSDLDAHHGEMRGNSQILNQCPMCGWRTSEIDDWPAWDGVLR
ncbi:unnamed protein product [Durusdinium trenchii]|uniref:RING-type domain-containing protein n=2 Tax=Durusdinium trenchii TaxID=1381693 RepID=A0ABP0LVY0_9DINO